LLLDLQVADDFALRTERIRGSLPRPSAMYRFAVPALLRTSWWPMISFVVFKARPRDAPTFSAAATRSCR
jgi:hypothetical protein